MQEIASPIGNSFGAWGSAGACSRGRVRALRRAVYASNSPPVLPYCSSDLASTMAEPPRKRRPTLNREVSMSSYRPKNILVTGGAGFIASHIVIQLVKQYPDYKVA